MSQALRLARGSGVYFAGVVIQQAANFLLLPIILHSLAPSDYGVVALGEAVLGFALPCVNLGIPGVVTRFYHDWEKHGGQHDKVRATWAAQLVAILLFGVAFFFAAPRLTCSLMPEMATGELWWWLTATMILQGATQLPHAILRIRERAGYLVASTCLQTVTTLGTAIVLLYFYTPRPLIVFQANCVGALAGCMVAVHFARIQPGLLALRDGPFVRQALSYALPAVPGAILDAAYGTLERFFLAHYTNATVVGLFAAASNIARGLIRILVHASLKPAWIPFCIRMLTTSPLQARRIIYRLSTVVIALGAVMTLLTALFARDLVALFSSAQYAEAAVFIPWLALVNFIMVWDLLALVGSTMSNRTGLGSLAVGIQVALNIAANALLVPWIGIWGAIGGFGVSTLVLVSAKFWLSARYFPIAFPWAKLKWQAILTVVGVVAAFTVSFYAKDLTWASRFLSGAIFAVLGGLVVAVPWITISAETRKAMLATLTTRLK